MSGNTFGNQFKVTTFGESHGAGVGAVIDGCPAHIPLSCDDFAEDLRKRRSCGHFETGRMEEDRIEILSGVFEGKTLGTPIGLLIRNTDTRPHDYAPLKDVYRPGHADFTYEAKYGHRDWRGGGRASGRETAARVAAGTVAKKILQRYSDTQPVPIRIDTAAVEIAGIPCKPVYTDADIPPEIQQKLAALKKAGDSAGALVQCIVHNLPAGLGEPVFNKLDAELAKAVLSIGAIKGIAFGAGFELARMTGSAANGISENHHGGILGGISDGKPVVFYAAVKPVPSIASEQKVCTRGGTYQTIRIAGRHDVCLYRRILPVVEAMTAIVLADMLLQQKDSQFYTSG